MDKDRLPQKGFAPNGYIYSVILVSFLTVCITAGIKFSAVMETTGLTFYDRYGFGGTGGAGFAEHLASAVAASAACLIPMLALFLLSFSPFLIPAVGIVICSRGFIMGTVLLSSAEESILWQLCAYGVSTVLICLCAAVFLIKKTDAAKKTQAFLAFAGGAVICEVLLSYLI